MTTNIVLGVCYTALVACLYLLYRNKRVSIFLHDTLNRIPFGDDWDEMISEFERVGYDRMLYSIKPLKIEKWYSQAFCDKLNSGE